MTTEHAYAVVMAGGAGTRFWPMSRSHRPKQLLALGGTDEPLIAATVRRIRPLVAPERVLVVTSKHLVEQIAESLPELPRENILAEPIGRNTAPCVAWATHVVRRRDPNAVLIVLAADHYIGDEAGYVETVKRATHVASEGEIVTVGIKPTRAETGYGYLELGEKIHDGVFKAARFVEKPNQERAKEFLSAGNYLWNSGMFFFRVDVMAREIEKQLPELDKGIAEYMHFVDEAGHSETAAKKMFAALPSISIDHGVMEKAARVMVVPGDFGWSDVGSWTTAWELAQKSAEGNSLSDFAVNVDAHNNFVRAPAGKLIALVGVHDLVVVDTGDTLLVIPRERAQDVREVVERLKSGGHTHLL